MAVQLLQLDHREIDKIVTPNQQQDCITIIGKNPSAPPAPTKPIPLFCLGWLWMVLKDKQNILKKSLATYKLFLNFPA